MGSNIGRARVRVLLLDRSPFGAQPKQEEMQFFKEASFDALSDKTNVTVLPNPINGIRVTEDLQSYDNFIADKDGNNLEDSIYEQQVVTEETATESVVDENGNVLVDVGDPVTKIIDVFRDPTAAAVVNNKGLGKADNENREDQAAPAKISAEQRDFFTWQVSENLFRPGPNNPPPPSFKEAPKGDNAPDWTYVCLARPGAGDDKNLVLTPFMRKNSPDANKAVHWGCTMKRALAQNQPFEVIYYFDGRTPAPPQEPVDLDPRFNFVNQDGKPVAGMDNLGNSIYLALEFGTGSPGAHFMLVFKQDFEPMIFLMRGKVGTLVSTFKGFNGSKIFDANNKFFSVKVEQVLLGLIIRSNIFEDTPWMVLGDLRNPVVQGAGPLRVYAGNVQGGFAMRPVQYFRSRDGGGAGGGSFRTPEIAFTVAGDSQPICTTSRKGPGEVEQDKSYDEAGEDNTAQLHMADAETINGQKVTTVAAQSNQGITSFETPLDREILVLTDEVQDENLESSNGEPTQKAFASQVLMYPSDVTQGGEDGSAGGGYTVKNGRSPYIWGLRCMMPAGVGRDNAPTIDISCDVMDIELNWNATSYQEINHTGSMRVLNRPSATPQGVDGARGVLDYRSLTNRATYVRIEAYWEQGVGRDPGAGNREIFEGIMIGADVTTRAETDVVTFKLVDYMNVLENSKFVLSPFYDGMRSTRAVRDIVLQTGFPEGRILSDNAPIAQANPDNDFGLPPPPALGEGRFRFKDGSSYKEAILSIAKRDFKTVYFDRFGDFHYDTMPGGVFNERAFQVTAEFWHSQIEGNINAAGDKHRLTWNQISFSRLINDVYNVVQVLSVDKRIQARISAGTAYKAGIFNPQAVGYLGYRKHLIIADPILGEVNAVFRYVDNYRRRVFIPPLTANFEIYGYTGLQPLQVIKVDGQLVRILNITTTLNAGENQYWMRVEGEWFFSVGKGDDPAILNVDPAQSEVSTYTGSQS